MKIKAIRDETEHQEALKEVERLFDAAPGTPESERLEALVQLIEAYEDEHYSLPLPDPMDALHYYLESRGLSPAALIPYLGPLPQVQAILNREQPLTAEMIRKLHEGLGLPESLLSQPYETTSLARRHGTFKPLVVTS